MISTPPSVQAARDLRRRTRAAACLGAIALACLLSLPVLTGPRPGAADAGPASGSTIATEMPRSTPAAAHPLSSGASTASSLALPGADRWINAAPAGHGQLPVVESTAGAWDAADGYLIVTDGDGDSGLYDASWAYSSGNWTELTTSGGLGALAGQSMAYDAAAQEVVLFGGLRSTEPLVYNNTTWTYRAGVWTPHTGGIAPPARYGASMVYDPAMDGVLLFGGLNLSTGTTVLQDLWLYRNGTWSELHPSGGPSARWIAQMAYDPAIGAAVLFGGALADETALGGTFLFEDGNWTTLGAGAEQPPALANGMIDYDPDVGAVVLTDGFNVTDGFPTVTWAFNGTGWSELPTVGTNGARYYGVGAWDPIDHEFILAGGNETSDVTLALTVPLAIPSVDGPTVEDVGRWATFTPALVGGPRPLTFRWLFDGEDANTTANASVRFIEPGMYTIELMVAGPDGSILYWNQSLSVVTGPTVDLTPPPAFVDAGFSQSFSARVSGGTEPFNISWNFEPGSAVGANITYAWPSSGFHDFIVRVVDADGDIASTSGSIYVVSDPTVTIGHSVVSPEVGVPYSLASELTGGVGPYLIEWSSGTLELGSGNTTVAVFDQSGAAVVSLSIVDSDGEYANATTLLTVLPAVVLAVGGPHSATQGTPVSWSAVPTMGDGTYSLEWILPNGSRSNDSSVTYTFDAAGEYTVLVWANDSAGGSAERSFNVSVDALPTTSATGISPVESVGLAGAVIVGIAAVVVAFRSRRPGTPVP